MSINLFKEIFDNTSARKDEIELKMNDFKLRIENMLAEIKNRENIANKQLIGLPSGRVTRVRYRGKYDVMVVDGKSGSRKRHLITNDRDLQILHARKAMLQQEIHELEVYRTALEKVLQTVETFTEFDKNRFLYDNFGWLSTKELMKACTDPDEEQYRSEWAKNYEKAEAFAFNRALITSRGLSVRSKSELLIAEQFYKYGIVFRYEQIVHVDERLQIIPDFTILKENGDIVIWEHEGLTSNKAYVEWQKQKGTIYADLGFVPWKNLIVTYDTADGDLDLRIIEAEIQNKLL